MNLTTQERKELREKIERCVEQAINYAGRLPIGYRVELAYHKKSGRISSSAEHSGEAGHHPAWINILQVQAWRPADDSKETTCQNINCRKSVDEWSEEIDQTIDEIEIWLETYNDRGLRIAGEEFMHPKPTYPPPNASDFEKAKSYTQEGPWTQCRLVEGEYYTPAEIMTEEEAWNQIFGSIDFDSAITELINDEDIEPSEAYERVKKEFLEMDISDFEGFYLRDDGFVEVKVEA